jgi:hypothetical protein
MKPFPASAGGGVDVFPSGTGVIQTGFLRGMSFLLLIFLGFLFLGFSALLVEVVLEIFKEIATDTMLEATRNLLVAYCNLLEFSIGKEQPLDSETFLEELLGADQYLLLRGTRVNAPRTMIFMLYPVADYRTISVGFLAALALVLGLVCIVSRYSITLCRSAGTTYGNHMKMVHDKLTGEFQ